jgi:hypothetical protein
VSSSLSLHSSFASGGGSLDSIAVQAQQNSNLEEAQRVSADEAKCQFKLAASGTATTAA